MSQHREAYVNLDARARRKQQDERRMHFRRAIESYDEQRQLHAQLMEFPDLLMISPLLERQAEHRQNV
ncbi:PA3496 family putative envelope integrity protein [Stutzerimonas xanthomarina]|uniref:PA3496 family putative envelope integrity protein n=1 Tax=Stutzerimonas xanthomarina TaxID=271420 RepID=UPI003AA7EC53